MKKIYLSNNNKKIAGICGGIGEYFNVDPVLIRVATIIVAIFTAIFPAVLAYIILWLVIPEKK
jgi:phage shock protein C